MRDLFDRLLAEGEAGIDRLVAERMQESVTLDFKEARGAGTGSLANEDRKTFAKALSAFANSAGGLLVFGVEARKGEGNVDCAQATKPISNIERFKSEATTASGQLLQPRHDGIVVEAIPSQRHPGAGYLLVYVERSERRPHQSQAAGQKQYFKRAGDSSFEMEHYDIEDAFRRISVPELEITCDVGSAGGRISHAAADVSFIVHIYLRNNSRVSARNAYAWVSSRFHANSTYCQVQGISVREIARQRVFELETAIIHPGTQRLIAPISREVRLIGAAEPYFTTRNDLEMEFDITFGCLDTAPQSRRISIDAEDVQAILNPQPMFID